MINCCWIDKRMNFWMIKSCTFQLKNNFTFLYDKQLETQTPSEEQQNAEIANDGEKKNSKTNSQMAWEFKKLLTWCFERKHYIGCRIKLTVNIFADMLITNLGIMIGFCMWLILLSQVMQLIESAFYKLKNCSAAVNMLFALKLCKYDRIWKITYIFVKVKQKINNNFNTVNKHWKLNVNFMPNKPTTTNFPFYFFSILIEFLN